MHGSAVCGMLAEQGTPQHRDVGTEQEVVDEYMGQVLSSRGPKE